METIYYNSEDTIENIFNYTPKFNIIMKPLGCITTWTGLFLNLPSMKRFFSRSEKCHNLSTPSQDNEAIWFVIGGVDKDTISVLCGCPCPYKGSTSLFSVS